MMGQEEGKPDRDTKYEMLLASLAQCAPAGTSREQIAEQFARELIPEEQAQFARYWEQKQQENTNHRSATPAASMRAGGSPGDYDGQESSVPDEKLLVAQAAETSRREPADWQTAQHETPWKMFAIMLFCFVLILGGVLTYTAFRPTSQPVSSATETPSAPTMTGSTATPPSNANAYAPTGILALDDPLADNTKGYRWSERTDTAGDECMFREGAYHAKQVDPQYMDWCAAKATDFGNFAYEIEMRITTGGAGGLFLRGDGSAGKWYIFTMAQNGQYTLKRYDGFGSAAQILAKGEASAFQTDLNQENLMAVKAVGSDVELFVNHQKLVSVSDTTYSHGQIGVIAGYAPAEVVYSNAKVWTL